MRNIFFIFLISSIFFISCGDKESEMGSDKISETSKIEFWHFWSEPYQRTVIDSLVKVFEEQEEVEVEITELSWSDGKVKLLAAFSSNTAPDVIELGSDWVAQFSSAGVLSKIEKEDSEIDKFLSFAQEPSMWKKEVYALPWIVDTRVMFVNMDILKSNGFPNPPSTYDEMLEMCKVINKKETYGFGVNGSDKHRLYKKVLSFIWTEGGSIYDGTKFTFDTPEVIEGVEKYVALAKYGITDTQKELDNYFAKGRLAFWISGSWLLKKINDFDKIVDLKLIEIPSSKKEGTSFAGGEYLSINNKSRNKKLATKLVKFLTDGKNSVEFCKAIPEAGFPADKNFYSTNFYNDEYKAVFANQLKQSKMTPIDPNWLEIEELFEGFIEQILYKKMTTEQAMKKLQQEVSELK